MKCDRCCSEEANEFSVPNKIWNAVMRPDGKERDDEYICQMCWDKEKSRALLYLSDLLVWAVHEYDIIPNAYDEKYMALAWRIGHWAEKQRHKDPRDDDPGHPCNFWGWQLMDYTDFEKPVERVQREWLDKILEMAVESGKLRSEVTTDEHQTESE